MKARQNSDDSTRAYERDAKMAPPKKDNELWHYFRILGELVLILFALVASFLITFTLLQG